MSITKIDFNTFLELQKTSLVIDVRTPAEFEQAHIPTAENIPIFSNEQRVEIGTAYKQVSRKDAIQIGLKYFGPNLITYINQVENLLEESQKNAVIVHCWRGGMRSAAMAWLFDLYGFTVYQLIGGYKTFRTWALAQFETQYPIAVLGGYTGSGKSYVLPHLITDTSNIIDLEFLASHKGSAFGAIGMPKQPKQEMFENILAIKLFDCMLLKPATIFMEDESQRIGNVQIPQAIWLQLREAKVYFLEIPFAERLQHIMQEYSTLPLQELIDATARITRNLGGLETKNATNFLQENNIKDAFAILLQYYDKYYLKGLQKRADSENKVVALICSEVNASKNARLIQNNLE